MHELLPLKIIPKDRHQDAFTCRYASVWADNGNTDACCGPSPEDL